jgi:hypothetical protein
VQSTPAGGLRDRQVAHGEAVPGARRTSWSSAPVTLGNGRGSSAACGASLACVCGRASDLGASSDGPRPRCRYHVAGPPPSAVIPRGHSGVGCVGAGRIGRSARVARGRRAWGPSRATIPLEACVHLPGVGADRCPPFARNRDGPVLKHGPRSAACMQGERTLIPMDRNERDS